MNTQLTLTALLVLVAALTLPAAATPYTNDITYQGQLDSDGSPYSGNADFKFTLYDSLAAGSAVSGPLTFPGTPVSEGVFTVVLTFPAAAFDGTARFLEIEVRTGADPFEVLSPRQRLTATPYAIQTRGINVDDQQNVGIGTDTPAAKLHVSRNSADAALRLENPTGSTATLEMATPNREYNLRIVSGGGLRLTDETAGLTRLHIDTAGRLGIGTPTPGAAVEVVTSEANALVLESSNTTVTRLRIANTAPGGTQYDLISTADASGIGGGYFGIRNQFGDVDFRMNEDGHIGIGQAPDVSNRLAVNGDIECAVLQINGGSDIAEPFEIAGDPVEPGMVVSIDPARPAGLRLSRTAYDRTVAGVVSGAGGVNPGMMLRQTGTDADGTHPVALTGRVYCYVDADAGGAVQPGDLLTTSATPGHAMRVTDHDRASGAILGKAMTALESGRGLVLVLVSLQ